MSESASYVPRVAARHETIALRGRRFGLTRWGPPSDNPVLLLHGWLDRADAWQLFVDALPDDWSLAALDWAGYGASEWSSGGYWHPECLADLEAVLDLLAPTRPLRVIAHSLGGTIASIYPAVRPGRMRWLVNLEGFGMPYLAPQDAPARIAMWLDAVRAAAPHGSYPSLEQLVQRIRASNPDIGPVAARYLADVWSEPAAGGGWQLNADPRHREPTPIRYGRDDLEYCWSRADLPVLLLAGANSDYVPRVGGFDAFWRWAQLYPHCEAHVVASAGHLLQYEQPATIAALVIAFAARHTAAGVTS